MNHVENSPARAPYGSGSITALPNGRFRVRMRLAGGRRVSQTCPTKADAERLRAALFAELVETQPDAVPEPQRETLATWGEKWLDRRELRKATRYPADERARWARYVVGSKLGAMPIAQVRRRDVKAWLDELLSRRAKSPHGRKPLGWQTVSNALALLRCALADAVDAECIAANPAADVKLPKRRDQHEFGYLTVDEVRLVLGAEAIPVDVRRLYAVAIFTGLRAGELWALQWGDVSLDGERPEITVRRSHHFKPKNGKVQTVPLLAPAREALAALRASRGAVEPDDLVFPSERGHQRLRGDDAGWGSRKVRGTHRVGYRELAGITRRVLFKELRHTCATHLVQGNWGNDWPIADVSKFLRHSGIAVTQRYADVSPKHLAERARNTPVAVLAVAQSGGELGPRPESHARNPAESLASPGRVELPANGLGNQRATLQIRSQNEPRGPIVAQSAALALLHGVEAGEAVGPHIDALVAAVLDAPLVRLALEAREPGPFRVRRALELAEAMLASIDARSARAG